MVADAPMHPLDAEAVCVPGYHVVEHLRRGSLMDVYDCWSVERRCRCVVKVLRPDHSQDQHALRRLVREGRLLQRLVHPHLVRAYEIVRQPRPALVLETLTGATLGYLLEHSPRGLGPADVAVLGIQLCSAVQYLHTNGILHLDLKPSNIIADGGLAKVLDLDIARPPGRGRGEGTRHYMAPEQVRREHLGPSADVWGIGVVLFEALTRRLPFEFDATVDYPQVEARAQRVRKCRPSVPPALAAVIDAALEPLPEARPTVDALAEMLVNLVPGAPAWRYA
jgi:serine/threonine protein kinase